MTSGRLENMSLTHSEDPVFFTVVGGMVPPKDVYTSSLEPVTVLLCMAKGTFAAVIKVGEVNLV